MFEKQFIVGWADVDANGHMRNSAYLDRCSDIRMMYFTENGFPMAEFARHRVGPVIMRDEIEYFKELHLMMPIRVNLMLVGLAEDGSRFQLRSEFRRAEGELAARVTSTGGWLDLAARKLSLPPEGLFTVINTTMRADDFRVLPSSIKSKGE